MSDTSEKKTKALEIAISQVDKQYGKGSIMHLDQDQPLSYNKSISRNIYNIDMCVGCLGIFHRISNDMTKLYALLNIPNIVSAHQ